jgi:hypothetical protein
VFCVAFNTTVQRMKTFTENLFIFILLKKKKLQKRILPTEKFSWKRIYVFMAIVSPLILLLFFISCCCFCCNIALWKTLLMDHAGNDSIYFCWLQFATVECTLCSREHHLRVKLLIGNKLSKKSVGELKRYLLMNLSSEKKIKKQQNDATNKIHWKKGAQCLHLL